MLMNSHSHVSIRVLRDALVSQVLVECHSTSTSGGRALLQARGLWLEQVNEHNSLGSPGNNLVTTL